MIVTKPTVPGTAAFSKGIAVLQMVSDLDHPTRQQLLEHSGLPRQTLHRLLKALEAERLIERCGSNQYQVGARMFHFAGRAIEQDGCLCRAESELRQLTLQTREATHLAARCGMDMIYLLRHDSDESMRMATYVGGWVHMHACSIGKSFLAFLNENERNQIINRLPMRALTPYTVTDRNELRIQLEGTRARGYAVASRENAADMHCFGAPIINKRGEPIAGVSVSVPIHRLGNDSVNRYVRPLLATCRRLSDGLGH